jgi:hypothetical protein
VISARGAAGIVDAGLSSGETSASDLRIKGRVAASVAQQGWVKLKMSASRVSLRALMSVLALGSATALSSAARADAERSVDCLGSYRVGSVVAYRTQGGQYDPPVHEVLAGARVFVYAQPGLTAEWLEYQIEQRAQAREVSQCPVDVEGVQVSVRSGGPGFWITLRSERELAATEILRRARLLIRP